MGEILDFILDFEKKLLSLLRDMVAYPKRVAESIIAKDRKYLSSFKFYSLVTSLWIVLFQVGNHIFDFLPQDFAAPARLNAFFQSEQDFAFLIAPFVGLVEFFLPFALVNYFIFRKQGFSLLNHMALNVYLGTVIILYEIPVFLTILIIVEMGWDPSTVSVLIINALLIAVPILYYGYVYVKVFQGKKWVVLLKSAAVVLVVSYFSISQFLETNFHEMIHRKIFYNRYARFDLRADAPDDLVHYTFLPNRPGTGTNIEIRNNTATGHAFTMHGDSGVHLNWMRLDDSVRVYLHNMGWTEMYSVQEALDRIWVLRKPWDAVSTYLSQVTRNGNVVALDKPFTNIITIQTQFIQHGNSVIFSGYERSRRLPLIGELTDHGDSLVSKVELSDYQDFLMDDVSFTNGQTLSLLLFNVKDSKLRKLIWVRGKTTDGTFVTEKTQTVYRNEHAPSLDLSSRYLHNGAQGHINDSTGIIAFQVMSDSSFVLDLTSLNTRTGVINWNHHYTVPADLSFYDKLLVDSSFIYIFGRAVSYFRKGFSLTNYQLPYLQVIDTNSGNQTKLFFLPMEYEGHTRSIDFPEEVYVSVSSVFQDHTSIYWNIDAQHSYVIDKRKLQ